MNFSQKMFFLASILFSSSTLFAQESEWKKLEKNFFQRTTKENSLEVLKDKDSLSLEIYKFHRDEKIDLNDLTKLQMVPTKTSFENFKEKIKVGTFKPELKKNSEYQLKSESPANFLYNYSLYLDDSITKTQIKNLTEYLNKNFKIEKLEFISKEAAAKKAAETVGVKSEDLFEGDLFPASIEIESKTKINLKNLVKKYSNVINDIVDNDLDSGTMIMKITT